MQSRYSNSWPSRGLTLIEVMAAIALLSTLLVGMLVAFQKHAAQIRSGVALRAVVAGVDQLLLAWAEQGAYPPADARGALPGVAGYTWRTHVVSRKPAGTLGLVIVRLEVHADQAPGTASPVLAIELPLPASLDLRGERTTP